MSVELEDMFYKKNCTRYKITVRDSCFTQSFHYWKACKRKLESKQEW